MGQDRKPPRKAMNLLQGRQVPNTREPPPIEKDKDPHALKGALDEVVAPHQGGKGKDHY